MARMGKVDYRQLKRLQEKLEKLDKQDRTKLCEETVKELAARMLTKLIKKTPVGDYSHLVEVTAKRNSKKHKKGEVYTKRVNTSGKKGGTLRRGWTSKSDSGAHARQGKGTMTQEQVKAYIETLSISKAGDTYKIELVNPVEYTEYVNSGHRNRSHTGWVPGKFFIEISEKEMEQEAPKIIEKKVQKFLEDCFDE